MRAAKPSAGRMPRVWNGGARHKRPSPKGEPAVELAGPAPSKKAVKLPAGTPNATSVSVSFETNGPPMAYSRAPGCVALAQPAFTSPTFPHGHVALVPKQYVSAG